jgi:argininosuccinate synthase
MSKRSNDELESSMPSKRANSAKDKVVLAYSGGLDTSVILVWLVEKGYEVICFCANVGQGEEDFEAIKQKALNCGASKVHVEDLRREFVTDFIYPAVRSNAIYEGRYLLGTSIARPCIAKAQVRVAQAEGAKFLAHGATGKGNDQVRFEMCAIALDAALKTIAPWRDTEFLEKFKGRTDLLAYAAAHNIPVDATPKAPYSLDANLYHTSYESGMLEDPMTPPMKDMFRMTVDPEDAPSSPTLLRIDFEHGTPVRLLNRTTGESFSDPLDSFIHLNEVAGQNGVGRVDFVENRFVGIKSRGVYETPAGTVLRIAHMDLEGITMDREVMRIRDHLASEFARLCYNGFWYAPEMELVMNSLDFSQRQVTGSVELKLYKGNVIILGRQSSCALYSADLASMDIEDGGKGLEYNPADAQGFIRINAVRLRAHRILRNHADNQLLGATEQR